MSNELLPGEVTPTLFVGLGGSGGRAGGRIAQHLRVGARIEKRELAIMRHAGVAPVSGPAA